MSKYDTAVFHRVLFFTALAVLATILLGAAMTRTQHSDLNAAALTLARESGNTENSNHCDLALKQPGILLRANTIRIQR